MKKMLLVDGQIFQTDARDRGMGRYSARLITSVIAQNDYDVVRIVLTKNSHANRLHSSIAQEMFPGAEIVHLNLIDTVRKSVEDAMTHNRDILNRYVEGCGYDNGKIDFLLPSAFQEPVVSVYPDGVKKVVVFYDLIPYLYSHRYRPLMQFENYLKRFSLLFEADLILAISKSVRDDLMVYLGIPAKRIVAVDGAPIKSEEPSVEIVNFDLPLKYVLMPTSDDPRKNNLRAVLGFEEFRASQGEDYKLIITSKIHLSERRRLELFSKNLVFTGNIKENELDWLYQHCSAVLFVPESEGLGLPVLEGALAGKRIVCSSLNVFKEISESAFYFCDHENQSSIALAITRALSGDNLSVPLVEYQRILGHYNWLETGRRAASAINGANVRVLSAGRLRLAMFVPKPDGLSAVGKVVAEGHSAMSDYFDIDYYVEDGSYADSTRPNYLKYVANYFPAKSFDAEKYSTYDAVIYHIGNSDYHLEAISNALSLPGYIILHDTNIGEAYRVMVEKDIISSERFEAERQITELAKTKFSSFIVSVCRKQLGVLVHSRYAAKAVAEVDKRIMTRVANLATYAPEMMRQRDYAQPVVGLAGIIADIKGIEVIESIANNPIFENVNLKLFGYNFAPQETIDRLKSYHNVSVSTNLTDFDFQNSISKLDIFINYRMKYQGETSLSTIEAMRQGVVVFVRDIGWYSELPDEVVVKVGSPEELLQKLRTLLEHPDTLATISRRAKLYIEGKCGHDQYAKAISELIDEGKAAKGTNQEIVNRLKHKEVTSAREMLNILTRERGVR